MNLVCFLLMSMITLTGYLGILCQLYDNFKLILLDEFSPPLKKKKRSIHYLFQAQTVICDCSGNI